jgi:hypothetical protein
MDIQREKIKRLLRRNLVQENLPIKVTIFEIPKNKKMMYLSRMLKLKIIIMKNMMWKCLNHMKSHKKMRIMKNPSLL